MEEYLPKWSEKAEKEIKTMLSWFDKKEADSVLVRPAYKSDFNFTHYDTRA